MTWEETQGMADLRGREAERRALLEGTPEARGRALRERVRAGDLAEAMLELAAYCGDAGAIAGGGLDSWSVGRGVDPRERPLGEWAEGLSLWGRPVMVRAGCAAARAWVAHGGAPPPLVTPDGAEAVVRVVESAEAWLAYPSEEHRATWALVSAANTPDVHPMEWSREADIVRQIGLAATWPGEAPVRAAMERALVAWALGEGAWHPGRKA